MSLGISDNLDFLAARLHGRRSQMAEGQRLETLGRLRSLAPFASEVVPDHPPTSAVELQCRLLQDLADEVTGIAAQMSSSGAELLHWLAIRFEVEHLKVTLRCLLTGLSSDSLVPRPFLSPRRHVAGRRSSTSAGSLDELVRLLPRGTLRQRFAEALERYQDEPRLFFLETELDRAYFREILAAANTLIRKDWELVTLLVRQEIDTYHLMLVARGRFHYHLEPNTLLPLHVSGTGISRERFAAMLADPDLRTAAERAVGRAVDTLPLSTTASGEVSDSVTPADLEILAWNRFRCLANRVFRSSHMGLAAIVAFVALRRVEVANLITLSEGIRVQMPEKQLRAHLIPRRDLEVAHV